MNYREADRHVEVDINAFDNMETFLKAVQERVDSYGGIGELKEQTSRLLSEVLDAIVWKDKPNLDNTTRLIEHLQDWRSCLKVEDIGYHLK